MKKKIKATATKATVLYLCEDGTTGTAIIKVPTAKGAEKYVLEEFDKTYDENGIVARMVALKETIKIEKEVEIEL